MDRSGAATILLLWQLEGHGDLVQAASGNGDRTLLSLVEAATGTRAWQASRPRPPSPPIDFLRLEEERALEGLRARFRTVEPFLDPGERERLESRLAPELMPEGRILAVQSELERFGNRLTHRTIQGDFESHVFAAPASTAPVAIATPGAEPSPAVTPQAVLLFARDGRLLANEGDIARLDLPALSELVARGDPGSTWSLAHRSGVLVGHVGVRAALVAVFPKKPKVSVGGALRVALRSLEERDRLANALTHPGNHTTLMAYVRAVRSLVARNA